MTKYTLEKAIASFWNRVKIKGENDCWEWQGYCMKDGYGRLTHNYRSILTHRLAWALTNGEIPDGLEILHSCDNPPCCNPKHLLPGTHEDNMKDMVNKGRSYHPKVFGNKSSNHKLSELQVIELRQRYATGGISQYKLADEYGISQSQVNNILNRKNWKEI